MGYLGKQPTAVPLTSADITDGSISNVDIADLAASKLTGSIADARVPESAVTQHVTATDLTPVRQDINALALYNAVTDNRAAYNLPYSFIDHFQDDTGITTETTVDRDSSGEYVDTKTTGSVVNTWTIEGFFNMYSVRNIMLFDLRNDASTKGVTVYQSSAQEVYVWVNGSTAMYVANTAGAIYDANTWCKWALTRDSSRNLRLYMGQGSTSPLRLSNTTGIVVLAPESGQDEPYLGGTYNNSGSPAAGYYLSDAASGTSGHGGVDEFRISSVARHTGTTAYSHDAGAHANDSDTELLVHYEENTGVPADSSSNSHTLTTWGAPYWGSSPARGSYHFEMGDSDWIRGPAGCFDLSDTISGLSTNATGTLISDTQTASVATTKMSGVILYKDNAGTATLGTDLKIYLSANGGTNYTEAASYGAVTPVFSTGVKMVRLGETTVTSGTTPVMKAVWANQVASSKETQLHGWAMNY